LHIVGRTIEPDNNGDVLDFGLNALPAAQAAAPPFYRLVLRPGVSPGAARAYLLQASHGRLGVQVVANPAGQLGIMQVVIVVSVIILAVIALANLLTSTVVGLRDHLHEASVLKAMGLTPRQVIVTLVVNATILTTIGVTAGLVTGLIAGPRLINMQGQTSGMGAGIAAGLSVAAVVEIVAVALAIAAAAALFLASRTVRIPDSPYRRGPARPPRRPVSSAREAAP
jgi:putative ABC transport system permease protein